MEKSISSGLKAYCGGLKFDSKSKHQEAVDSFTRAIKYGYTNIDVFLKRGCSLQLLHQHELAIQNFNRVIYQSPDDCYPLFLRSVSTFRIGDIKGAIKDIQNAIILSLAETETNDEYLETAQKLGWESHTALYEAYLNNYRKNVN